MYPNLYFVFKDLFGVEWGGLRFVNSFGFFVAIAFILAAWVLTLELSRKSKQGLFQPTIITKTVGEPASITDLLLNFLLGFVLGYKVLALFFSDKAKTDDPPAFLFSSEGSWPLGILLGVVFLGIKWWEKKKQQLAKPEKRSIRIWPQDRVGEITVIALVFGLVGAKLFDIFENWSDFVTRPSDYLLSPAGLTFYGGLICAAIAIWWYARKNKIGFLHLADATAPGLMLAYGVGRIGCHVAGDGDWGVVNNSPKPFSWLPDWMWSYKYPNNVNEDGIPIPGCVGKYCNQLAEGHYPTPLYEAILGILLFFLLWSLRKRIKVAGVMFALYLMVNGLERFLIEKIRVNVKMDFLGFHPTQAEIISAALFLSGLGLMIYFLRKNKNTSQLKD